MIRRKRKTHKIKPTAPHMFNSLVWEKRNGCRVIMPNVYVDNWNECDALCVLRSGYTHEVEIKITRSDFKADFKKTNWWQTHQHPSSHNYSRRFEMNKHEQLEQGIGFPNRFSFLVPDDMVDPDEVPDYCGLMYFNRHIGLRGRITTIRQPKLLHKNKIDETALAKLSSKFVWRYIDSIEPTYENVYGCDSEDHW